MSEIVVGINPKILQWARERSGYTLNDVAEILNREPAVIESWESGDSAPTYIQLERLAYQIYKRPVALFFFPWPPSEPDEKQAFRTLPDFELENLTSDTLYALREAKSMQLSLQELNDGVNPADKKFFFDIQIDLKHDYAYWTNVVRKYLEIPLQEQIDWQNNDIALKLWRNAVETKGIFIFKRSFKQRDISGFCLLDENFPIIYLNNSSARSRQIFTIFHELAHILLHTNGITKASSNYIDALHGEEKAIEIFCNQFAGEFLVPAYDFKQNFSGDAYDDRYIRYIASRYKVSREVILRKLLDMSLVDREYYKQKAREWNQEYEEERNQGSGGNYYATKATYLGDNYLRAAFRKYHRGNCTIDQLANYLNIAPKNIPNLEQFLLGRVASQRSMFLIRIVFLFLITIFRKDFQLSGRELIN